VDRSRSLVGDERARVEAVRGQADVLVVWAKADLPSAGEAAPGELVVSARTGEGLVALRACLRSRLLHDAPVEHAVLTDVRHAQALGEVATALTAAHGASVAAVPLEYLLEDLRRALQALGTITGGVDQERLYDRIFATFCIGK